MGVKSAGMSGDRTKIPSPCTRLVCANALDGSCHGSPRRVSVNQNNHCFRTDYTVLSYLVTRLIVCLFVCLAAYSYVRVWEIRT